MKYTKIIIAAALALTLTACADTNTNTAEETTLLSETTSEAVVTENTTTATEGITTTKETTTTAEPESETTSEETEETTDTSASEKTVAIAGDGNDIAKVYADILFSEAESGCMALKCNLIDLDSDGISELVITYYTMGGYDHIIYKSDGSEVQGLWNDYSLMSDYATVGKEYSMQQYKDTETNNIILMYIGCGSGMGFTYAMDAVMQPESLIAQAEMNDDYSAMEMDMTVYKNGEAMGTAEASRSRNKESDDPFWNDWDSLEEAENLYNSYFGKYEFVSDNISDLNPIIIDGEDEIFFKGEFIVSQDELTNIISEIISE